jgi:peptide/nickel transport system substrate-binding protein
MKSRDGFDVVNAMVREPVTRRRVLQALGWSGLGLAAGPLGFPGLALGQRPKSGGTIKIGIFQNIDTLDPHQTTFITATAIHNNIYNGLLKVTWDGKSLDFVPEVAKEWEIVGDRTHIFRLHKGVTFHNGDPLNAAAVRASLERVKDPKEFPIHAWKLKLLEGIETPDAYTVKLIFAKPYPFLRVALTGSTGRAGTIVNVRAAKQWGKDYGRHPVGTGPFKFVEWKESDYILLERNPSYWETDASGGRLPYLDKVLCKFIIEPSTMVAALQTGEIDGANWVAPQFVAMLRANPKLNVYTVVGGNWRTLHLNLAKEPFSDKALRKAVAFAINREEILKQVEFGEGIVACGPISPPMTGFYDPNFCTGRTGQYHDLDQAKALVKQSKYPTGADAVLLGNIAGYGPRQAEALQAQLAKIGIRVKIELVDSPTFRKRWLKDKQWDIVMVQWDADLDPDETLFPELHSKEEWNAGRWVNPEFDRLVELAQVEPDQKKRKKYYDDSIRLIYEDAPVAIIAHLNEQKVFAKHVKGFQTIPNNAINMHAVWLDKP